MLDHVKVSVVMAIYNGKKYLKEQLESIVNQTITPTEIIVVDDASNESYDDIFHEISKLKKVEIKYHKHKKNEGYAQSFFEALSYAIGDFIFFSDQDDIWEKNKIKTMLSYMQSDNSIKCLSCKNILINENGEIIKKERKKTKIINKVRFENLIRQIDLRPGMTLAIQKSLQKNVLKYNTKYFDAHDRFIELIACSSNGFFVLEEYLNKYRIHDANTSGVNLSLKPRTDFYGRLEQINKEIKYLSNVQIIELSKYQVNIINSYIGYYNWRKSSLKKKSIALYIIEMGVYLKRFSSIRILIGDIYSIINEKRKILNQK